MSSYETQRAIIESIESVVEAKMSNASTTNSLIGFVTDEPNGFEVNVSILGEVFSCTLPEHLHSWIQAKDVVIVQDLYGDGRSKIVTGKTGTTHKDPALVFYDDDKEKIVSGRDGIFDEGVKLDTYGTVKE